MPDGVAEAELLCLHSHSSRLCPGMGAVLVEPLLGSGMGCSQIVPLSEQESGLDLRLGLLKPAGHSLPREHVRPDAGYLGVKSPVSAPKLHSFTVSDLEPAGLIMICVFVILGHPLICEPTQCLSCSLSIVLGPDVPNLIFLWDPRSPARAKLSHTPTVFTECSLVLLLLPEKFSLLPLSWNREFFFHFLSLTSMYCEFYSEKHHRNKKQEHMRWKVISLNVSSGETQTVIITAVDVSLSVSILSDRRGGRSERACKEKE